MKLIDADKLIELFSPFVSEDKKVVYQPRQLKIDDIKNAPTVKAIPIEWIEKQIEKALSVDSVDLFYVGSLKHLIKVWEKENEAD